MSVVVVTGSTGLVGSECVKFFSSAGLSVVGIDNDMRTYFFGEEASNKRNLVDLIKSCPSYVHHHVDIRDNDTISAIFKEYSNRIVLVIHAAGQPSHDWASREPATDFTINANGTLNLLEATRLHAKEAVFIFTSTNKVYGDRPNQLPIVELEKRWEVCPSHPYESHGIDETMSIDMSTHSLFGASKVAGDILTQEYGRYFNMKTGVFRGGCLTGPTHNGTELHGFLAYLTSCAVNNKPYTIYGYKGKQVRDNIHSKDLVTAFWHFFQNPRAGEVYNIGGSRCSNISVLEAIQVIGQLTKTELQYTITDKVRTGDHIWYVSDVRKFQRHYPKWKLTYTIEDMIKEMVDVYTARYKVRA